MGCYAGIKSENKFAIVVKIPQSCGVGCGVGRGAWGVGDTHVNFLQFSLVMKKYVQYSRKCGSENLSKNTDENLFFIGFFIGF